MLKLLLVISPLAATTARADIVNINFDNAPPGIFLPAQHYAPQGVVIRADAPGGLGNTEVTLLGAAAHSVPPPAAGLVITPFANLAGFLTSFIFEFSTPVDYFNLYAFGDQAFTVQATGGIVQNIAAQPGRLFHQIQIGAVGSGLLLTSVRVIPTTTFPFPLEPSVGPGYYDLLSFNRIPSPGAAMLAPCALALSLRWRR